MDIGKMNKKITIQSFSRTPDEGGGNQGAWVDVRTIWARVTLQDSTEETEGARIAQQNVYEIETRYYTDITRNNRILLNGNPLEVQTVNDPYLNKRLLRLTCIETG